MTVVEWCFILVLTNIFTGFITWGITFSAIENARKNKCCHNFEEFCHRYTNKSHQVAYICTKCGDIKRVKLNGR